SAARIARRRCSSTSARFAARCCSRSPSMLMLGRAGGVSPLILGAPRIRGLTPPARRSISSLLIGNLRAGGFLAAAFGVAPRQLRSRRVLKGLEDRFTLLINARKKQDPLLRLAQLGIAVLEQADSALVAGKSLVETGLAVF